MSYYHSHCEDDMLPFRPKISKYPLHKFEIMFNIPLSHQPQTIFSPNIAAKEYDT
jgi:hypothetical protein